MPVQSIRIPLGTLALEADLSIPEKPIGIVIFAHGSGSSRHSSRNRSVADHLVSGNLATLLMDLLTHEEEKEEEATGHLRFDIALLAKRLIAATDYLAQLPATKELKPGYFGASTGGGAALVAAAQGPDRIAAVVSRGGR